MTNAVRFHFRNQLSSDPSCGNSMASCDSRPMALSECALQYSALDCVFIRPSEAGFSTWNMYHVPDHPTWTEHVRPILEQHTSTFEVMNRRGVDPRSYEDVIAKAEIVRASLSLRLEDPDAILVSLELSLGTRQTILKWLDSAEESTGLPVRGSELSLRAAS